METTDRIQHWGEFASGIVILGIWVGCAIGYGFLGFALGWLPAVFIGLVVRENWQMLAGIGLLVGFAVWYFIRYIVPPLIAVAFGVLMLTHRNEVNAAIRDSARWLSGLF